MNLTVTAAYISGKGIPVVITNVTCLPLRLIVKPCAPIKEADYKVTISTNKPAISLLDLFPEFILDSTMSNAAGFQYFGGPYVTVLSSKTSQRYRLQSDNLACLWLLVQSLYHRLSKRFSADKMGLECSYSSSLPLHEYYSEIEMHFHKRKKLVGKFTSEGLVLLSRNLSLFRLTRTIGRASCTISGYSKAPIIPFQGQKSHPFD